MRVLNVLGVVGICVLLALSADAEKIKKPAVYTRYGAAKAVFSCALEKELEFELREEDQDRVGPVLQSLLHWVKEQGTREWMKHRLSRFDDESLARLSQDCGAMAESELRKTLRLPGRRDGEKALKVTFGPRNATAVRLAAASSGGRSLINRSHPEVSARFLKKLGRGLKKFGKAIVTVIRKPKLVIDLIKPKRMRTTEIEAAWYRRYDFNPNGPGLLLVGISGFKMPGQAIKLKIIKEKAVGTTKQQYGRSGTNDESDAFRHTYSSYLAARELGGHDAQRWFDANERSFRNELAGRVMDLHNNKLGRQLEDNPANSNRNEVQVVREALRNGLAMTSPPDVSKPPPPPGISVEVGNENIVVDVDYDRADDSRLPKIFDNIDFAQTFDEFKNLQFVATAWGDPHLTGFDGSEFMFKGDTNHVFEILSHRTFKLEAGLMMTESGRTYFNMFKIQSSNSTVQILAGTDAEPAQVIVGDHRYTENEMVRVSEHLGIQVVRSGQEQVYFSIYTPKVLVEIAGHGTVGSTQHLNMAVEITKHIEEPNGLLGSTLPEYEGKKASEMSPKEIIEEFGSLRAD